MADLFYALPSSTTYTPLSPASNVIVQDIVTPILPVRQTLQYQTVNGTYTGVPIPGVTAVPVVPRVITGTTIKTVYGPTNMYYYDSGIGENPLAQHDMNSYLRYKFLDRWLTEHYQDILRSLKVSGNSVKVLSKQEAEKNDISKDSEEDVIKKVDFIGAEILSLSKNKKLLDALCMKNNLKYYDLPSNEYYVRKAQSKYVIKKLDEMRQ